MQSKRTLTTFEENVSFLLTIKTNIHSSSVLRRNKKNGRQTENANAIVTSAVPEKVRNDTVVQNQQAVVQPTIITQRMQGPSSIQPELQQPVERNERNLVEKEDQLNVSSEAHRNSNEPQVQANVHKSPEKIAM